MNKDCGYSSGVEHQISNLSVAGSNPVARSNFRDWLELAVAFVVCNWMALIAGLILYLYNVFFN